MTVLLCGREVRALLFDLDGTLVDSAPDLAAALDATLVALGWPAPGEARARRWVGNGAAKLVARGLADALAVTEDGVPEALQQQALSLFLGHYGERLCRHSRLYPGVPQALAHWQAQGVSLALVTNKPSAFIEPLLQGLGLNGYFRVILGGDSLAVKKPHPEPLQEACRRLSVAVGEAVMVGDSRNDVQAARAAGMPVIGVDYGYNHGVPLADEQPDILVSDLRELIG